MDIDIEKAKEDLRKREGPVVRELNQIINQEKLLAARKKELIEEAHRLNGEARQLNRLSEGNDKISKN